MQVYKLTEQQKDLLIGQMYVVDVYFNPIQDINGNWIISQTEVNNSTNEQFMWVKDLDHSKYWEVKLWGDGSAMREFLHVDDLAEACYICMQQYNEAEHINVGTGKDVTIRQLAETIADIVVYNRDTRWDTTKPNGTPRKVLNVDKIKAIGWEPKIDLYFGIETTYKWYKENACK